MAKLEQVLRGNFDTVLAAIHNGIIGGSASASFEDGSDYAIGQTRCAVRVYERYSMTGSNRLSLSITLLGNGEALFLTGITAGGSQAMFFKINTFGESAFLDVLYDIIRPYM